MNTIQRYLSGKKILLFGLGRQGGGTGDLAYLLRHAHTVTVADDLSAAQLGLSDSALAPSATYRLGNPTKADIKNCDLIIKNPGVPDDHPLMRYGISLGKTITSAIALFVKYSSVPTIGVTGTRGKTTTSTLLYEVLNAEFPGKIVLGGNIPGTSGLGLFDQLKGKKYVVLELSSFQLHSFHALTVSPTYAVFTNFSADHLNRYSSLESYLADKTAIFRYLTPPGFLIYNRQDSTIAKLTHSCPVPAYPFGVEDAAGFDSPLAGEHNRANLAAVIKLASRLGVKAERLRQVFASFSGVAFRFQTIHTHNGVRYINDTTATTPVAAVAALRTLTSPTILICGGASKNLPFTDLVAEIKDNQHVKKVVLLGSLGLPEFTHALRAAAAGKIVGRAGDMHEAITLARQHADPGDTVLLSPGFASFDLFKNEFDRGAQFNTLVLAQ